MYKGDLPTPQDIADAFMKAFTEHTRRKYGPGHTPCWTLKGLEDGRLVCSHEGNLNPSDGCELESLHYILDADAVKVAAVLGAVICPTLEDAALWAARDLMAMTREAMEPNDGVWPGLSQPEAMEA